MLLFVWIEYGIRILCTLTLQIRFAGPVEGEYTVVGELCLRSGIYMGQLNDVFSRIRAKTGIIRDGLWFKVTMVSTRERKVIH